MQPKERILVALDTRKIEDLVHWTKALGPHVGGFKIGLEALLSIGLKSALNAIRSGVPATENIFVDAKIHDIPNTMAGAVRAVVEHPQVKFVNVHASAGIEGMRAAASAKGGAKLLAVTILTSLDAAAAAEVYGDFGPKHETGVGSLVLKFARAADAAGCDGVVCSPQEIAPLRRYVPSLALVTPGVRPSWASADDQKRVMTPGEAVKAGATYLVIGRPITKPPEKIGPPVSAARLIADEIAEALR